MPKLLILKNPLQPAGPNSGSTLPPSKPVLPANKAIPKGLLDLADLNLVIAGNAKVTGLSGDMHQFTCQHGPEECYGNAVEACIWSHATSKLGALMSIKCMFAKTDTDGSLIDSALVDCAAKYTSFDVKDVQTCANSSEGNK